jgi:hypothetical protein
MVDGLLPAPGRVERPGDDRVHGRAPLGRTLLEAGQQELADERVAQRHGVPVEEPVGQPEGSCQRRIEVGRGAGVDDALAQVRLERVEQLLGQVVEQRRRAPGRVGRIAKGDAERPALRTRPQGVDLVVGGLSAGAPAQQLCALGGAEGELGGRHLGQPAGGGQPRRAQPQRAPRGERHAQASNVGGEQHGGDLLGPVEMLGVVDHEREGIDEEPGELDLEVAHRLRHVDDLRRRPEAVAEHRAKARHRAAQRVEQVDEETSGVTIGRGAAHPGDVPATQRERLLERHRLA